MPPKVISEALAADAVASGGRAFGSSLSIDVMKMEPHDGVSKVFTGEEEARFFFPYVRTQQEECCLLEEGATSASTLILGIQPP